MNERKWNKVEQGTSYQKRKSKTFKPCSSLLFLPLYMVQVLYLGTNDSQKYKMAKVQLIIRQPGCGGESLLLADLSLRGKECVFHCVPHT